MARVIYTHSNLDLDAVLSVLAALRFIPDYADAIIKFVSADWDGSGMEVDDLALDINAGGKGIKGELESGGIIHSCFEQMMLRYASAEERSDLALLIKFIGIQDAYGSVVQHLLPDADLETKQIFAFMSLNSILRALQAEHPRNDQFVLNYMGTIFDGMLKTGRSRRLAKFEAEKAEILPGKKVAIVTNSRRMGTHGILFEEKGIIAIVYIDGFNLGVVREGSQTWRADNPFTWAVVEAAGEIDQWFSHPAGFLFCRGSRKSPAITSSKVNPRALAEALNAFLSRS